MILKPIRDLFTIGCITLILSIIGLLIFKYSGKYILHPSLYILGVLMGIGWLLTGYVAKREFQKRAMK